MLIFNIAYNFITEVNSLKLLLQSGAKLKLPNTESVSALSWTQVMQCEKITYLFYFHNKVASLYLCKQPCSLLVLQMNPIGMEFPIF